MNLIQMRTLSYLPSRIRVDLMIPDDTSTRSYGFRIHQRIVGILDRLLLMLMRLRLPLYLVHSRLFQHLNLRLTRRPSSIIHIPHILAHQYLDPLIIPSLLRRCGIQLILRACPPRRPTDCHQDHYRRRSRRLPRQVVDKGDFSDTVATTLAKGNATCLPHPRSLYRHRRLRVTAVQQLSSEPMAGMVVPLVQAPMGAEK